MIVRRRSMARWHLFGNDKLIALGVFLLATAFVTFPLIFNLDHLIIGRPYDDAFESIWYLYWYKHALFDLHVSPLFQPGIFSPAGWDLRFSIFPPFYPFLLSPLTLLVGPVTTYNLTLVATCVVAAYGMYLAARVIGVNLWGGLLAGVAYAFGPQCELALNGHLNVLLGSMWLPWILYSVIRAARLPEKRTRAVVIALVAYALSICGAWPFVFIGGLALLIAILGYWLPAIKCDLRSWLKPLGLGLLAWSVIAIPLLGIGLAGRSQLGASSEFSFPEVDGTAASVDRLVLPSALNPLVLNFAPKTFRLVNRQDGAVALGYVPAILAALYLLKNRRLNSVCKTSLSLFIVGVVLMLGTTLYIGDKPVSLPVSNSTAETVKRITQAVGLPDLTAGQSVRIPLPALMIYWLVPMGRSFHHFGRWEFMASLGIALLGGLGLTVLIQYLQRRRRVLIGSLAVLLLLVEFNYQPLPNMTTTAQMHRSVDDWLASQPESNVIIEYPLSFNIKAQSLYYTMVHQQKIIHGYSIFPPAGFAGMQPILDQWPAPQTLDLLKQIGVRYVLVDSFQNDDFEHKQLPELLSIPRLKLVGKFPTNLGLVPDVYLFELVDHS